MPLFIIDPPAKNKMEMSLASKKETSLMKGDVMLVDRTSSAVSFVRSDGTRLYLSNEGNCDDKFLMDGFIENLPWQKPKALKRAVCDIARFAGVLLGGPPYSQNPEILRSGLVRVCFAS